MQFKQNRVAALHTEDGAEGSSQGVSSSHSLGSVHLHSRRTCHCTTFAVVRQGPSARLRGCKRHKARNARPCLRHATADVRLQLLPQLCERCRWGMPMFFLTDPVSTGQTACLALPY